MGYFVLDSVRPKTRFVRAATDHDRRIFLPLAKPVTYVSALNLTVRQRTGENTQRVLGSRRVTMARLIPFYVPQNFKPPKQCWLPQEQRGKIIEFQSAVIKKSA
jgi:hypothetical protein